MRRSSSHRTEGSLYRMPALALASFWLAAQAAGVLHLALVPHLFCAQHGEFIDGHAGDELASAPEDLPQPAAAGGISTGGSHHQHSHEHCLVAATGRREVASFVSRPSTLVVGSVSPGVPDATQGSLKPRLPLLHLAPKQSPPV